MIGTTEYRYVEATVEEAKTFALSLRKEFLDCRVNRHGAWIDKDVVPELDNVLRVVQVCPSCTTERHCEISRISGRKLSNWTYKYPTDYQTKEIGRLVGDSLAILSLVRFEDVLAAKTNKTSPLRKKGRGRNG